MQPLRLDENRPDDGLDYLFSITYEELKRIASWIRAGDPAATLNPTALVNEAWVKLSRSPGIGQLEPLHFKRIAARAMRQLLVEAARRRKAQKRVTPERGAEHKESPLYEDQMAALDEALKELATVDTRHAAIVEAKFFGGLETAEIAVSLGVSESTVTREWRVARAWLGRRLEKAK